MNTTDVGEVKSSARERLTLCFVRTGTRYKEMRGLEK
jgi:hypothetical protein